MVNILEIKVSPEETSLLSRGLNFAPQPPRVNKFQLKKDLEAFGRRLRLREFFYNSDSSDDEDYNQEQQRFKEKSTWNPLKNRDPSLETYLKAVEKDTWNLFKSKKRPDNLPVIEREALTKLRARTEPAPTSSLSQQTKDLPHSS